MKVVTIISRMNVGGPAVLLSKLIDSFPSEEIDHTLITGVCLENETDYLDIHPISTSVIYVKAIKRSLLPVSDLISIVKVARLLRSLNPDIVHTHTSKAGVVGRLAAKVSVPRAKIIHTYHGHLLYGYFSPKKTRVIVLIERILGYITHALVAVSVPVKNDLLSAGIGENSKWRVIHAGLDVTERRPRPTVVPKDSKFRVTWVGRFTDIKNPKLAIDGIYAISPKLRDHFSFQMIGDGELFRELKEYANQLNLEIDFPGWVDNPSILLAKSDLLLMTSRNEGMPVVILEAALQSVPCLSTEVGGVKEFITENETGFLINEDVSELANKLTFLLENSSLVKTTGDNAYDFMKSNFSLKASVESHLELYGYLLKDLK